MTSLKCRGHVVGEGVLEKTEQEQEYWSPKKGVKNQRTLDIEVDGRWVES